MKSDQWDKLIEKYPLLQEKGQRGNTYVEFRQFDEIVAGQYFSHSYVIPFVSDGRCIVTQRWSGKWVLPGGTRETDEGWRDTARRELVEEEGAKIIKLVPFGMYDCLAENEKPVRPFLPHPRSIRVVSWAEVKIVTKASDPDGVAGIKQIDLRPCDDVTRLFWGENPDFASLYLLARELKQLP